MADYSPLYDAGLTPVSLTASNAAISGGDPLVVAADGTVAKAAALASPSIIGVAAGDAVANGRVTVWPRGPIHYSLADGTVTAGDQVGSTNTANRQVKTIAAAAVDMGASYTQGTSNAAVNGGISAARAVLGVALTTAADNTRVRWMQF